LGGATAATITIATPTRGENQEDQGQGTGECQEADDIAAELQSSLPKCTFFIFYKFIYIKCP